MVVYYPTIEIPLLCFCIGLWIFCCHLAKKRREAESCALRSRNTPSVYIIPIYTEDLEDEEQEEEMDINEAFSPLYSDRNFGEPPPYTLEPPSYGDPPPSYMDPPAYSERP